MAKRSASNRDVLYATQSAAMLSLKEIASAYLAPRSATFVPSSTEICNLHPPKPLVTTGAVARLEIWTLRLCLAVTRKRSF